MILKSPAKINLSLQILEKRADGYHNLQSEFLAVDLCDKIKLTQIPEGIQIIVTGKYKVPNNRDNLAYQIAEKIRPMVQGKVGVKIEIEKNIPLFAGLGGGSSNAATVLKGLIDLWDLNLSLEKQVDIAKKIGADLPFFLYGGHCLVEGIGEKITPLEPVFKNQFIVIAQLPHIRISTPWAYSQWDKHKYLLTSLYQRRNKKSLPDKRENTNNDFEKVIFPHFPDLADLKADFLKNGAIFSSLTGSGSAIYGIFKTKEKAEKYLEKLKENCEFACLSHVI